MLHQRVAMVTQVFHNMKLVKAGAATEAQLAEALAELEIPSARPAPAARVQEPSSSSQSVTTGADTKLAGTGAAVGRDTTYDPPAPPAAAEAKKRLPGAGVCTFWPRMPCLRCGCPWWSGEDWDARRAAGVSNTCYTLKRDIAFLGGASPKVFPPLLSP